MIHPLFYLFKKKKNKINIQFESPHSFFRDVNKIIKRNNMEFNFFNIFEN